MDKLQNRFISLWHKNAFVPSDDVAYRVFEQLVEMYAESWRSYHNLDHIRASLNYFDACKPHAQFADAIEFSIWFHDCIYVFCAQDNEARSRDWFIEQTGDYIVPAVIERVDTLIMDTRHHSVPESHDGKLIADIDLTSFGLSWNEYIRDSRAVQDEYPQLSNGKIVENKIKFLHELTCDGQIYYSDYYLTHFEEKAQNNVKKHLHMLQHL